MRHHTRLTTFVGATTFLASASLSVAGNATFTFIPDSYEANDLTPDGRYVVGGGALGAYRYDTLTGTMLLLPGPVNAAVAVSDDGTVIVGNINDPKTGFQTAVIWHESTNTWASLGYLDTCDVFASSAYEITGDGKTVVGLAWEGCSGRGFRWTAETGMEALDTLWTGGNRASVVSSNGNVIAGFAQGVFDRTPAFWGPTGDGALVDPTAQTIGEVQGINDAGTALLGTAGGKAMQWTNGGAVATLVGTGSALPGWTGIAMDMANNGTIVGFDLLLGNRRAWIRPGSTGPIIDLRTYAEANGAVISEDVLLQVCQAISIDGSRIIGHGGFFTNAWIVTIDPVETCVGDIAPAGGNGIVDGADLGALLGSWGGPSGDLNGDGTTDGADLGALLGAWGPCPAPTGACCVDGDCSQKTEEECAAAGGTFVGDYSPCSASACVNNDACADAIDITSFIDGPIVLGDNSYATPPRFSLEDDADLPVGSPSCQWNGNPGAAHSSVWYSFVAPPIGAVSIRLCESVAAPFNDSIMSLYSGECGALVEVACSEDDCVDEFGNASYYSWIYTDGLVPGQRYYLAVMNAGDWGGSVPGPFKLTITGP